MSERSTFVHESDITGSGIPRAVQRTTHHGARHTVVYGHYAVADPGAARGQCICIDARCGFPGGALMAYRHPETTRVMVPMAQSEHEFIEREAMRAERAARLTSLGDASKGECVHRGIRDRLGR